MYHKAIVLANEEHAGLPKLKTKGTSRLKLLRRTLRNNSGLARRVRELHMSEFQWLYQNATIEREEIANLVASLVMACPRLERLVGFHIHYSQAFDRLSHALSTRSNLKERVLMLVDTDADVGTDDDEERPRGIYIAECDPIERFLELSSSHSALSTLVLHQQQGQSSTRLNFRAIVGTFRNHPYMRHLAVSGLAANSFTSMALNAIPTNLESLRLESLPGITEKGIQRFATSQQAIPIRKLALINLDIESIHTVAGVLSTHFANLREFLLVQTRAPTLLYRRSEPSFRSPLLRYIHWELCSEAAPLPPFVSPSSMELSESQPFPFTNSEPIACLATSLLAAGIQTDAFPSLRRICIPHDPQGVIQSLCKPLPTALLPSDTSKFATASRIATSDGFSIMLEEAAEFSSKAHSSSTYRATSTPRVDSVIGSPMFKPSSTGIVLTPMRSRLAAQSRILAARKNATMVVRVSDPEGKVRVNKVIGGHVGRIGSKIIYDLRTTGRNEWITAIDDLVGNTGDTGTGLSERNRGSCGHVTSRGVVRVEDLF
ncbi:hypothetical protein G6011_11017 [Alternaria panax]|uniref:Uncharacterized protein n=1 Tax=Alternaria panax TaxID=48097 RepID=A0AAD4ID25_9PLEO|nr:hypothetical protein G6011_11017 [Alternaria panax]